MKKHSTAVGPTGFGWMRSLLTFRHRNPVARTVSTVLAFAIAMMLVIGSGAAYADDTAPAPTDTVATTDTSTTGDTTTSDEPSDAPAEEPSAPADAGSSDNGGGDTSADSTGDNSGATDETPPSETTKKPSTLLAKSSDSISSAITTFAGALSIPCVGGPATVVGGFEIDGNTCVQGNLDWDNSGSSEVDGFADNTGFTNGTSENDPPTSWSVGGTPNGKTDIGTAWAYSHISGGNVFGYFAITNDSTSGGTSQYDLEYNQLANTSNGAGYAVPNRSPGDLLFRFSSTGSDPILFTDAKKYTLTSSPAWSNGSCFTTSATGGWCTMTIPPGVFAQQVSADGTFFEGAINISLLFGSNNCSGTFGATQIRSVTGNAFATSALKDYVKPLSVSTPSTCGKIVINKQDMGGKPLGGATFSVSPNPDPTKTNGTAYSITDNDSKDTNPAAGVIEISPVDPNESYTVTETGAPTGYLLPNPASQGPTLVGPSQTASFTFHDPTQWKALTATTTATPTYKAEYAWSITKEIGASPNGPWYDNTTADVPLVKEVAAGDPDTLFYKLTVLEGARTTSQYKVSGTISVTNPNDAAVTADISDSLPGATCLVDGVATRTVAVPAGGPTAYPYVCTFAGTPTAGQLSGTNTAHVAWDKSDYPQVQADVGAAGNYQIDPTAAYAFGAETTSVNKTVTITDDQHTFSPAWQITWSKQGMAHVMDYSHDVTAASGSCSAVFSNTATITGDNAADLGSDSAHGKVCEGADLTITRMDAETLTRTFPWSIEKSTSTPKVVVADGKATAEYTVTVTAGDGVDSAWNINGTITVHNPNGWESVDVTSLPVSYTGGGTCAVTGASFPVTIAANGEHDFAYSCDFDSKPDYAGTIDAAVHWSAAAASTPNSSASDGVAVTEGDWDKTLVNDTVTVHDDHATPGDTSDDKTWDLTWATVHAMPGHQQELTYSADLAVPDGGTCAVRTNTVKVVGDNGALLDADQNLANNSADVKVCSPLGLSVSKTAAGSFTRTYNWSINKFINGDQSSQDVHIDAYQHTFSYKVKVTPGAAVDSAWVVAGTITVKNDNTDTDIAPIELTSVSDLPAVGAAASCSYTAPLFPIAIASNQHVDVGYSCTFAEQPTKPYGGTNTAKATWGQTGSATSPAVPVTWNSPTEVDKSIDVFDDKVNLSPADKLGTVDWNADGTPTVFDYTKNLSVPETTVGCGPNMINTAWLGGTATQPTNRQDSATARICPNPGTWTVSKVNVDGDGPIPTDSDITYRLTAHKTGGVNPKDVVLTDNLSDIAPYITGAPTFAEPAGTTVEYDATTHVLTWTIDELGDTDRTLDFTVHVAADAHGVDLPNLVTSPGSENCPDAEAAGPGCKTDNDTPHFTLAKSSDAGDQVMPPYLGADGTVITYTLTVHNDSDAPINATTMPGAKVTDDLSKVLDDAHFVADSIDPADQAELVDDTLTWTLPNIPVDGTVTLTYKVQVDGDQWDQTLTNVASPSDGGDCAEPMDCTTTTVTPPYTQIQVKKVDAETGEGLPGAKFTLFHGEDAIGTATSGEDGLATFPTKLRPGHFTVQETEAPAGYGLPVNGGDVVQVTIDGTNFVANGAMAAIVFADPAQGEIAELPKAQFERDASGAWVPSDGVVEFGEEIRYVMTVTSTGTKLFHDVTVGDYVPGYNPADTVTAPVGTKAVLEAGSATCTGGFTCVVTTDLATGLVTWRLTEPGQADGDLLGAATGTVEFTVRMPDIPGTSPIAAPGTVFAAALWNQAYLDWREFDPTPVGAGGEARPLLDKHLVSNEVVVAANQTLPPLVEPPIVEPPVVSPPQAALPNTGGPNAWLLFAGLSLLLGGTVLVAGDRRRKRRS